MIKRLSTAVSALACACCISLAAPAIAEEDPAMQPLVTIDGFTVKALHLALFASQTGRNPQQAEEQVRMLNELANNFMLANSVQGKALAKRPEINAALEVARARLIAQAYVRTELAAAPIDEDELRKRYDNAYGGPPAEEYKARHILLNSRDAAVAAIKELDKGADFAELASKHSIGPSKSVGGDLGWFERDQMVAPFADATAALANGSYTPNPVKTQFGWHVILREDSREITPPDFATARPELESQMRQEHVAALLAGIREKAAIEVHQLEAPDAAADDGNAD